AYGACSFVSSTFLNQIGFFALAVPWCASLLRLCLCACVDRCRIRLATDDNIWRTWIYCCDDWRIRPCRRASVKIFA
ncbi:unnamed protein product, partial [Amoebophrya sp. A120]